MSFEDSWRIVNVTVAGLLLGWQLVRALHRWEIYSPLMRDAWWLLTGWLLTAFVGTLEVLLYPDNYYRLIIVSLALAISARILWKNVDVVRRD